MTDQRGEAVLPLPLVVHVIPYDGIGGVEVAARSVDDGEHNGFRFWKCYLAHKGVGRSTDLTGQATYASENDLHAYFSVIRRLWVMKPEVLIASLWRSCVVLVLLKIVRPRTKTVVFLHFTKDVHFLDKVFSRIAMALATEIWTDSVATRQARIPKWLLHRSRVISFMVESVMPLPRPMVRPKFIFWGRLQAQKGLDLALELFARIRLVFPDASFAVIGPDGGLKSHLLRQVALLNLGDAVEFLGSMSRSQIVQLAAEHSFYLQTSVMEGMAMSVVEAMQLGLVPVVTPVGEIAHYCADGESAIFVGDIQQTVRRVGALLVNPEAFSRMATAAQGVWQGQHLYRDDVLAACSEILDRETSASAD